MPTLNRSRRAAGELFGHRVVSGDDLDAGGSVGPRPIRALPIGLLTGRVNDSADCLGGRRR